MRVGYVKVSRKDWRLEPQRDLLVADDCGRVFEEKVPSREAERDAPREAFDWCREDDVLVVARLDRMGRSLRELVDFFHVFGALAEFEREIICERTMAGLESARARGLHGGKPRAPDENGTKLTRRLKSEGSTPWRRFARCSAWGAPPYIGTSLRRPRTNAKISARTEQTVRDGARRMRACTCATA